MANIESIISKIEATLKEARDQITTYEYRIRALRETVSLHEHTLALLRSATDAPAATGETGS